MITVSVTDPQQVIDHITVAHETVDVTVVYINLNKRTEVLIVSGLTIYLEDECQLTFADVITEDPILFSEVAKRELFVTFLRRNAILGENIYEISSLTS